MDTPTPTPQKSFVVSLLIGLLAGGLAGGATATVVAKGGLRQLFSKTPAASTSATNGAVQTLTVQEDSATTDVVKKVSPAVVSVIAKRDYSKVFQDRQLSPFDSLFGLPFDVPQPQGKQDIAWGTGFIVESDGLIVTNKHVVSVPGADEYVVVLNNEQTYQATVLATDPTRDIAIIKIDAKDLDVVALGSSDDLQVGQSVVAIGNALGQFQNTATKGVISGLARSIRAGDGSGQSEQIEDAIQTDAAINRGNSGGPLLNMAGQAIGINTAVSEVGQNLGFAIPVNFVKDDLESVKASGKIVRPFLGVCYTPIDKQFAEANSLSVDYGALVQSGPACAVAVVPGSPADKAGIVENDIVLEIGGEKVTPDHSLAGLIGKHKVGEQVEVKLSHKGEDKTVTVTLEERKQ